jgi:two-component system chemotaxis response regulator CheY
MFGGPFVLVIDDDEAMGEVLRTLLTEAGYPVLTASDGASGYNMASQYAVCLIVVDMLMPITSGLDFIRHYRATCGSRIPIIATSVCKQISAEALQLGATTFVTKPFHCEALLEHVQDYVYSHPSRKISWL